MKETRKEKNTNLPRNWKPFYFDSKVCWGFYQEFTLGGFFKVAEVEI